MKTELIKYIRDKKNRPIACLIAVVDSKAGVRIGFSKYSNKETEPFNKEIAKNLARSRARNSTLYTIHKEWNYGRQWWGYTPVPNFPASMIGEMNKFIERVMKYFHVDKILNNFVVKEHEKPTWCLSGPLKAPIGATIKTQLSDLIMFDGEKWINLNG